LTDKELQESQLVRSLIGASVDGLLAFDRECRYTAWNAAMERISGLRSEEVVGRTAFDLFPFLKQTGEDWYFYEALAGRSAVAEARPYTIPETGHRGFFDGYYSPLRDEKGEVVGGVGVIRDITASHEIEEALRASEERYRAFIANSSEGIWRFELEQPVATYLPEDDQLELFYRQGYLAECNDAMARMYGYDRAEEITGARLGDFVVRDDPKNVEYLRAFIASGYRLTDAVSVEVDREGRQRFFSNNLVAVIKDGLVLRAWGTQRDVTGRMRAEEALRESEEKYRGLLENANDLIYSHDLQGKYLTINRACEDVTGYTREELLGGLNIAQVVVPEHLELAKRMTELKLRDPSPTVYEIDINTKEGRRLTLEVSTRVSQRDGHGAIIEGIARDVTDRKRGELEREELLAREQQARREAEEALGVARSIEDSLGVLVEASGVLLGSLTIEDVQPAILDISRRLIAADAYAIWRGDPQAKVWRIVSSAGLSEEYRGHRIEGWEPGNFVFDEPVIAESVEQVQLLEARRELYKSEGIHSLLAVPIRIHGHAFGTLTYYYRQPHRFSDRELRVATALANLSSAAISSAELYDEQRRLRAEAQMSERRSNFLAEASSVLSSTLDYEATLARVAQLSVPDLADWCAVDISEEDQSFRRLAVAHVDPLKVEWAHEIQKRYPPDMDAPRGMPQVLRTGVSEIYPEISDEMLADAAIDEEHLRLLRGVGLSSAMIVPLLAHGRTHGVVTFISAESGRRYGAQDLALAEDLARRAAVAVENARLYQAAQKANRLKDEFLATVSHELRTPLTSILGWAHLLRAGRIDEKSASSALETIERNARAQSQLIDDLLDVSRIITGKLRLDVRQVDPGSLIEAAIEALRPAAEAKDVRIQKVLDTGVISVAGDPARLQQVVWNLLSNAIKFTPKGGRVQVRLERVNSHIEIAVSDTGIGIKPAFLPHVFERFRQADQKTTRQYGGLGLGLAIVRHLVELHGGTVQAESTGEGQGATFVVKLPLVPVYQKKDFAERIHPAARDTLPSYDCPERLDGLKVLVVDDEADARELLRVGIGVCGAQVRTAGSVQEALEAIENETPDLLISDIGMPDEDGYELIRRVRALPADSGGRVPAIALTAYARTEDRLHALRAGYQMHVPKPVEMAELMTVAASLIQRRG
jgi:PAS domain S-box-containing protein